MMKCGRMCYLADRMIATIPPCRILRARDDAGRTQFDAGRTQFYDFLKEYLALAYRTSARLVSKTT
jgi:hypothetical protein